MFNDSGERKMFKGNWKCSECQADITELPFEPSGDKPLYCRDCHSKMRKPRRDSGERKMFQGNWKCSECGKEITELPFEPSGDKPIQCRDCHMASRR